MSNWKELIEEAFSCRGETWDDVVDNTMSEEDMLREFYDGFGTVEGCAFTLWTTNRVYFPVSYDGAEWVASVPRNPNGEASLHVGG
jgi:hypothetical protein